MGCLDENAVLDLLAGRLSSSSVREVDVHVASCEDCRALLFEAQADAPSEPAAAGGTGSSTWLLALGLAETGRVVEATPSVEPGMRIAGRYLLGSRIGEGGMGVVWSALDETTGEHVALKFLKAVGKEQAARMMREAKIAASVKHPGVVEIFDVLDAEDLGSGASPVIVMELLGGESLAARLRRRGPLTVTDVASILSPVVDAVAAVHEAGIVHRDLKPENIFVLAAPDGGVKVLDFGLAKRVRFLGDAAASSGSGLTRTGAMIGTPHYMAPEQVFGEKTVDARADAWALGVIAYECLAGARPITGENFGQVLKNITMGTVTPLSSVADVPAELGSVVHALMSRDPDARPSLAALRDALVACSASGAAIRPATSVPPMSAASAKAGRRPTSILIGIAAAACVFAVVGVVGSRMTREETQHHPAPLEETQATSTSVGVLTATATATAPLASQDLGSATATVVPPSAETPRAALTSRASAQKTSATSSASSGKKLAGGVEKDNPY